MRELAIARISVEPMTARAVRWERSRQLVAANALRLPIGKDEEIVHLPHPVVERRAGEADDLPVELGDPEAVGLPVRCSNSVGGVARALPPFRG